MRLWHSLLCSSAAHLIFDVVWITGRIVSEHCGNCLAVWKVLPCQFFRLLLADYSRDDCFNWLENPACVNPACVFVIIRSVSHHFCIKCHHAQLAQTALHSLACKLAIERRLCSTLWDPITHKVCQPVTHTGGVRCSSFHTVRKAISGR